MQKWRFFLPFLFFSPFIFHSPLFLLLYCLSFLLLFCLLFPVFVCSYNLSFLSFISATSFPPTLSFHSFLRFSNCHSSSILSSFLFNLFPPSLLRFCSLSFFLPTSLLHFFLIPFVTSFFTSKVMYIKLFNAGLCEASTKVSRFFYLTSLRHPSAFKWRRDMEGVSSCEQPDDTPGRSTWRTDGKSCPTASSCSGQAVVPEPHLAVFLSVVSI